MKKFVPSLLLCGCISLAGCGGSQEDFVFNNNGATGPVARPDAYSIAQDNSLVVASLGGVLANDTLNAASNSNVSVNFPSLTQSGGTLTSVNNDGSFTYIPAPGFVGSDSFSYTLSNGFSSSSASVAISVTAAPVTPGFFVNSADGDDSTGDPESGSPFATVQAAVAAAGPNTDIIIIVGRGNYTGTVTLQNGQRLLGRASSVVSAQSTSPPTLSGPIILADNNTLDFLRVARTNGIAIDGDGQDSGRVTNCQVADTTGIAATGIQIRGVRGDWTIQGNTITNTAGIGLDMDTQNSDTAEVRVLDNSISGSRGFGIGMAAFGGELKVQVTNNQLSDNLTGFGTVALASSTATLCLQILNNENDDVYRFSRLSDGSTINVEQFDDLETLNTGTVFNAEPMRPITDVDAGFCGF